MPPQRALMDGALPGASGTAELHGENRPFEPRHRFAVLRFILLERLLGLLERLLDPLRERLRDLHLDELRLLDPERLLEDLRFLDELRGMVWNRP